MKSILKSLKSINVKGFSICLVVIFFLTILAGCVTKEARKDRTDEDILRERIKAYWDYKVKQDFDKAYGYEDPLFRKKINLVNYIKGFNTEKAGWTGASIEGLTIEGDSAIVDMKVRIKIIVSSSGNLEQDVSLREKWVKVEGLWYHVPQKIKRRQSAN